MLHLKPKSRKKLLTLFLLFNVTIAIFQIFIEDAFNSTFDYLKLSVTMQLVVTFSLLCLSLFMMYLMYRQLLTLFLLTPFAKEVFGEDAQEEFMILLQKHSNNVPLTYIEKEKFRYYAQQSKLIPDDYLERTADKKLTAIQKIGAFVLIILLVIGLAPAFARASKKHANDNEPNPDSGQVPK